VVAAVDTGSPAAAAGMRPGDEVLTLDGQPVAHRDIRARVEAVGDRQVALDVRRDGEVVSLQVRPRRVEDGYLRGVRLYPKPTVVRPGLGDAIVEGVRFPFARQMDVLAGYAEIVGGRLEAEFVGPVGMVSVIGAQPRSADVARTIAAGGAILVLFA